MNKKPDFLAQLREKEQAGSPSSTGRQAARVTARGRYRKHGQYWQVTFRLPGDYVDAIEAICERYPEMSKEDVKRWLLGQGLAAFADGARPDVRPVEKVRPELPEVEL